MSRSPLPVITLASVDPVARGAAVAGVLCDVPDAAVVQYDVEPVAPGTDAARLRRLVVRGHDVVERLEVELEHGCLSCAVREDVLPTLHRLAEHVGTLLVLALPVAAEPLPVVHAIRAAAVARPGRLRTAAVVTAAEATAFVPDLFGTDTLAERGLDLFPGDERAVGEALAHQVEVSDVLATTAPLDAHASRLLRHLALPPLPITTAALDDLRPARLARLVRPVNDPRGDLQRVRPAGVDDGDGVWTLDLACARPVHPGRLLDRIEALGSGLVRARGHVRLASRPHTAVAWDGAGGQLSIGSLGPWNRRTASTRLVVTGSDPADRSRIALAFDGLELTEAEHARGARYWSARGDDLEPWLGDLADCA